MTFVINYYEKNYQSPKKWLFSKFSLQLQIFSSKRTFFAFIKVSYLQPFKEIMGGQRIRTFSAKMTTQAKKMTFFRIFFLLHIYTSRCNFYVLIKISYLQPFREIMGDKKKALHRTTTNNDNEQRRTTLTMIIARQDSQNPRANNHGSSELQIMFLFFDNSYTKN